jgi:hypothetical protein
VETVVEQNRVEVSRPIRPARSAREWEEAREKVEAYLRAWKLPGAIVEELTTAALDCARSQCECDSKIDPMCAALDDARNLLRARLNEMHGNALGGEKEEEGMSHQQCAAILWSGLPEQWAGEGSGASKLAEAYTRGARAAVQSLQPQRPPITRPMVMQTSLTRLPSFRIIAGWFVLIALLVLAFILTR